MNDFIIHYGIKGQRWGIRNYQNEDGTLTAAGKERYSDASREYKKEANKLVRLANNADINRQKDIQKTQIKKAKTNFAKAAVDAGTSMLTVGAANLPSMKANSLDKMLNGTSVAFAVGSKIRAGKATYHAIRAAVATHKIKEIESGVAIAKYRQQVSHMTERFANTPYSGLVEEKIAKNKERGIE